MQKKVNKIINYIVTSFKEDYKFILVLLLTLIIFTIPLNYYIVVGGGASDISERVEVEDKYDNKGSINLSYVTQLPGDVLTYLLSYVIPTWERESTDDYKYDDKESIDDIEFRSDLDLKAANATAIYWAYTLAGKEVTEISSKFYVAATYSEYKNGLKVKDEIISIDDNKCTTLNDFLEYIDSKNVGDTVNVKVIRNKKELTIPVKLSKYKNKKILGIVAQNVKEYKTEPDVTIKFKRSESGPSAGLMTTLEIYNQLTKKDITKGLKITGTGTIEPDGTVGEIGGIEHKVLGAVKAKSDVFLVPDGQNYKDAKQYIKDKNLKIKLIKVSTIQDALNKLDKLK